MKNDPLVSVVIATRNRAAFLQQSVHSVLTQTFQDFELLLVDDGSTDDTKAVIESMTDPRVRYLSTMEANRGISAARNVGADASRGLWTAVHDDDDLMLPWRLKEQLAFANSGDDFIYGTFINFDDISGSLQFHHGRLFNYGSALETGFAPGHSTWLIKTELLRQFRYDEGLESAVDNNLAFRLLRSGIEVRHSGVVCLLRRVHTGRITDRGAGNQKYGAQLNLEFLRSGINSTSQRKMWEESRYQWGPTDKREWETRYLAYLPDELVRRNGTLVVQSDEIANLYHVLNGRSLTWNDVYTAAQAGANMSGLSARYAEAPRAEEFLNFEPQGSSPQSLLPEIEAFVLKQAAPKAGGAAVGLFTTREGTKPEILSDICDEYFVFNSDAGAVASGYSVCESTNKAIGLTDRAAELETKLTFKLLSNSPTGDLKARVSN